MFGTFQQSQLRIEVPASGQQLRESLLRPEQLRQWLLPQRLSNGLPEELQSGASFITWLGPVPVHHGVERAEANCLRLLLSQGIDGFHEWYWGDGWVQSRLEGVSLLPLNLGHTATLLRLRQFVGQQSS
jgi:hypothetical protein